MKIYNVFLKQSDEQLLKIVVPANSKKEAESFCQGNGDIEITTVSNIPKIDNNKLWDTLKEAGYPLAEIELITRLLCITKIGE